MSRPQRFLAFLLATFLIGCAHESSQAQQTEADPRADTLTISADSLQANLDREMAEQRAIADTVVIAEALTAVTETRKAVAALAEEDSAAALEALERAAGKLEILLARRPELGLVPLDATVEIVNTAADLQTIERLTKEVEELVEDGHMQAARRLLEDLVSELRVTTVSLPLATYPDAIRLAARSIEEGDTTAAQQALAAALSTLVIEERAVPLPLIDAEAMVEGAEALAARDERGLAVAMLADARYQLRRAEALGYGRRDREFSDLEETIEQLEEQIEDEEETGGAFRNLREQLRRFKERITG